jgi:hypothetical protein
METESSTVQPNEVMFPQSGHMGPKSNMPPEQSSGTFSVHLRRQSASALRPIKPTTTVRFPPHLLQIFMKIISLIVFAASALLASDLAAKSSEANAISGSTDPGWPREKYSNGTRLIIYQPQVDDWKNFQELTWRMAVSLTPKSGKEAVGVVEMKGNTDVDNVSKVVVITNPQVTGTYFPSLDQATKEKVDQLFKTFVPPTISISLHRLIASVPKQEASAGVQLNNDPP